MGLFKHFSSSSYDKCNCKTSIVTVEVPKPLPNPSNYKIIKFEEIKNYLIIEIKYLDCTNYEGNKVMLYECSMSDLLNQKNIDPHFSDNSQYHSPIARFKPTKKGWEMCRLLIYSMIEITK